MKRDARPASLLRIALAVVLAVAASACGSPPNQRLLTRTSDYMKAMVFGFETGFPLDFGELERKFPELKGIVISAAQWIDEYERMRKDAEARGKPLYEYRIPYGASITVEVRGEPDLTRTYAVPPNGTVHYPYLGKVQLAGKTVDDLKAAMERDLAVYLRRPEVLVHVNTTPYQPLQGESFYQQSFGAEIIVLGAARRRFYSNFAFTGKETLLGVLGTADLPPDTEWRQLRVIRRDPKDPLRKSRIIICDLWDYFAKGDVRQDIPLAPGDVVFVPVRWSTDDQFWEDWGYVKRIMSDVLFLDDFTDELKKGGDLRN